MKPVEPYLVIRDTLEKEGYWDFPVSDKCAGTISKHLDTGDYTIKGLENVMRIERKKTVGEFARNIHESRFDDWVSRLSEFTHSYLVMEFSVDDVLRFPVGSNIPKDQWSKLRVTPQRILSVIAKLQVNYGIHVIFAGDVSNAMLIAENIFYRTQILYSGGAVG